MKGAGPVVDARFKPVYTWARELVGTDNERSLPWFYLYRFSMDITVRCRRWTEKVKGTRWDEEWRAMYEKRGKKRQDKRNRKSWRSRNRESRLPVNKVPGKPFFEKLLTSPVVSNRSCTASGIPRDRVYSPREM